MSVSDIERLIQVLAKVPGLGPRSARRAALMLIKRREALMLPLVAALSEAARSVRTCSVCANLDTQDPCAICADPRRDSRLICVVEDVADLWALERAASFPGHYHVLGGVLSALDGVGPEDLRIPQLLARVADAGPAEVILATNATVDGQTTAHYIADRLAALGKSGHSVKVSALAHGVPIGGELDYLDDGTLSAALRDRRLV